MSLPSPLSRSTGRGEKASMITRYFADILLDIRIRIGIAGHDIGGFRDHQHGVILAAVLAEIDAACHADPFAALETPDRLARNHRHKELHRIALAALNLQTRQEEHVIV